MYKFHFDLEIVSRDEISRWSIDIYNRAVRGSQVVPDLCVLIPPHGLDGLNGLNGPGVGVGRQGTWTGHPHRTAGYTAKGSWAAHTAPCT